MEPVVVRDTLLLLAGVSAVLPRLPSPAERVKVIRELWTSFLPKASEIPGRIGAERYAVIENDVHDVAEPPLLRAMVAVESFRDLPSWCERFTVEPGRYAVFLHHGLPSDFSKTVVDIQKNWVSKIPGLFEQNLEFVIYPAGYSTQDPNATFEYWLPLP